MPDKEHPTTFLYNDIEKANQYWRRFERDDNITLSGSHVVRRQKDGLIERNDNTVQSYQNKLIMLNGLFEQISFQNCVFILIWDIVSDRFVYALDKRKVVGYEMSLYLADNGIHFSLGNFHPNFLTSLLTMQHKALEYIVQYKGKELNKIVINFDGKYKKCNGDYFHFLQQIVCLECDPKGSPVLFLAYIHDITYAKKEKSANLIITAPDEIKLWNFNFDNNCLEPLQPLSKQEKNVLFFLANGKSSKEIAKELFISPHTVDTHRRNLLRKTNCLDSSGLVTYAKLVGLF